VGKEKDDDKEAHVQDCLISASHVPILLARNFKERRKRGGCRGRGGREESLLPLHTYAPGPDPIRNG